MHDIRRVRIQYIDLLGHWRTLSDTQLRFLPLHKTRLRAGQSSVGSPPGFRVIDAETSAVLDKWYSEED